MFCLAVMSIAGCSDSSGGSAGIDASDPRPLITGSSLALGRDYWAPLDLANVYVYPDRTVIRVSRQPPDGLDPRLVGERFALSQDEFDQLVKAAEDAGLTGGGAQPAVSLPEGTQVADGSRGWFTYRQGETTTVRVVDQPSVAMDEGEARTAIAPLVSLLSSLTYEPQAGISHVPLDRWVITATPTSREADPSQEWLGPDVSILKWEQFDAVQCAIVTQADWPLNEGERFVADIVLDGKKIKRRPLLPHETTCAEVLELRRQLKPVSEDLAKLP